MRYKNEVCKTRYAKTPVWTGTGKNLAPPQQEFDPRTVQPVAQSLYRLSYRAPRFADFIVDDMFVPLYPKARRLCHVTLELMKRLRWSSG